ncbi:MAG TPA: 30S ribosomal protein S16 [Alphaproteobacteria bacterium]
MALKIRLARRGTTNAPFYHIVVADSRSPRDGNYIEKLGYYDPTAAADSDKRLSFDTAKAKEWMAKGAQPTERVAKMMGKLGAIPMPKWNEQPAQSAPKKKAQDRAEEKAKKAEALKEAEEAAA